jgi:hypothetical protein
MAPRAGPTHTGICAHCTERAIKRWHTTNASGADEPPTRAASEALDGEHDIQGRAPDTLRSDCPAHAGTGMAVFRKAGPCRWLT